MEDQKTTPEQEYLTPETEPEDPQAAPEAEAGQPAPEPEDPDTAPEDEFASPVRPKNTKQNLLLLLGTVLVIFLVYLSTSLIYKISRGETWNPFSFLTRSTTEAQLPTVPTVPVNALTSTPPKAPNDPTLPVLTTTALDTSETSAPTEDTEETTTEAVSGESTDATDETDVTEEPTEETSEEPTEEPTTEEPTTEEPTTEEPTTEEPTTEEPTTEEPTTEEPTTEPTTEAPSTEWVPDFTVLADHLRLAGMEEADLKGTQLIIARGSFGGECLLYFFEKTGDDWVLTDAVPGAKAEISFTGVSTSRPAGSSNTPGGYYAIGPAYGQGPSAFTAIPYQQIREGDQWVTDPDSAYYNQLAGADVKKDWKSSIDLSVMSDAFKYALQIQYNTSPIDPALGTSIFLNVQTDRESDGSIGTRESTLFALLQWLKPEGDPHILIYPYEAVQE
ncbi:MAG: hypothetical protein J5496_03235 [Lachnospiraceae bacterium]|nr:hypothetical protein [Lachnospiraceae bacterium]